MKYFAGHGAAFRPRRERPAREGVHVELGRFVLRAVGVAGDQFVEGELRRAIVRAEWIGRQVLWRLHPKPAQERALPVLGMAAGLIAFLELRIQLSDSLHDLHRVLRSLSPPRRNKPKAAQGWVSELVSLDIIEVRISIPSSRRRSDRSRRARATASRISSRSWCLAQSACNAGWRWRAGPRAVEEQPRLVGPETSSRAASRPAPDSRRPPRR